MEYRPEIIELARKFIKNHKEKNLNLGQIKNRFSNTVGKSYTSFGCYSCDSIFGDFFVMEAKHEIAYGPHELTHQGVIELNESVKLPIPHWCLPDNKQFC